VNPGADLADRHHGVSRIMLRQVLLTGLADVVTFGATFERYEVGPDGRVNAHFADRPPATGDLLVGADGANSVVRRQLLPHAKRIDTGVRAIAGKVPLTDATRAALPPALTGRANCVLPRRNGFLFTAVWHGDRQGDPTDYTFWAYADAAGRFPDLNGGDLTQVVLEKIRSWSPHLRELVERSDPATVNALVVRSATPVPAWPTGPVTLLGDAIHNMTPMAGIGANTALRDAELLSRRLGSAQPHRAVAGYEREMRDYGFAAVKTSLRNARQAGSGNPVARGAFRTVLRTVNAVPALKRRMSAGLGQ
jgi:2-polyprenyl-6-methoxyphenol hydroxylase-like FAD-dependent oxidoreductase